MGETAIQVDPPRIPDDVREQTAAFDCTLATGEPLREPYFGHTMYVKSKAPAAHLDRGTVECVIVDRAELSRLKSTRLHLDDVRVTGGDLANARFTDATAHRLRVERARATGLQVLGGKLRHVHFEACRLDMALFEDVELSCCRFHRCDLTDADFRGAVLAGVHFSYCDLRRARFTRSRTTTAGPTAATPAGLDLRGSNLAGLEVTETDLRGAVVDPSQLLDLARLHGYSVEPLPNDADSSA